MTGPSFAGASGRAEMSMSRPTIARTQVGATRYVRGGHAHNLAVLEDGDVVAEVHHPSANLLTENNLP